MYCIIFARCDSVVCQSVFVMTVSPAIAAEPIEVPLGTWIRVGPRNCVLDGVQIPKGKGTFEGMTSEFSRTPPITVPSRISPHAVDQRSDWPAAEAVEYHIKFSK